MDPRLRGDDGQGWFMCPPTSFCYRTGMHAISPKAVLLALLAVLGIDILSGMIMLGIFAPNLSANMTDEELRSVLSELMRNRAYILMSLILGTASTALGGYLAARLARTVPYFNALAFGILGVLIGLLTSAELPTWYRIVAILITIPAALTGAHFAKQRMQRMQ